MRDAIQVPGADVHVYVIAASADREHAAACAVKLRMNRCQVTSTWHDDLPQPLYEETTLAAGETSRSLNAQLCEELAATRFGQLLNSQWVVVLSTGHHDEDGAMHTELGFAVGIRRQVIVIGEPSSMFHCLRSVKVCKDVDDFLMGLTKARFQANNREARAGIAQQAMNRMRGKRFR